MEAFMVQNKEETKSITFLANSAPNTYEIITLEEPLPWRDGMTYEEREEWDACNAALCSKHFETVDFKEEYGFIRYMFTYYFQGNTVTLRTIIISKDCDGRSIYEDYKEAPADKLSAKQINNELFQKVRHPFRQQQ